MEAEETSIGDLLRAVAAAGAELSASDATSSTVVLDGSAGDLVGPDALFRTGDIVADGSPVDPRLYLGPVLTFSRRAARKAVSWYVQPVVDHVNEFHQLLARYLRRLDDRVGELESEVARLRDRDRPE